jgi:hypothetical protein
MRMTWRGWRAVLAGVGCLWLAGCASAREATPAARVGREVSTRSAPVTLALQRYRTRLRTLTATVGGQTGRFLLDTAGGLSLFTPDFARRVGCEPWGRLTGFQMMGGRLDSPQCNDVRFEVPGATLHAPVVAVLDFMSFFPKDAEPVDGVIALDVFAGQALTWDLGNERLILETPESLAERTRTMSEGQLRIGREVQGAALSVFLAARTPKGTAWFELDSGNGGTLLVSKHIAPLLGLDPKVDKPQPARFELAGNATVEGNVHVPDMIIDGNLGMPFLALWVVTTDLAHARVWLQPNGKGPESLPPPPPPK